VDVISVTVEFRLFSIPSEARGDAAWGHERKRPDSGALGPLRWNTIVFSEYRRLTAGVPLIRKHVGVFFGDFLSLWFQRTIVIQIFFGSV